MVASPDPKDRYVDAFSSLGMRLQDDDGCSEAEVAAGEARLGVRAPAAIRAYFLLSGRETVLNQAHNHLLLPSEWCLDAGHLIFLAENQNVVLWGTDVSEHREDPPILQGVNGDQVEWHPENERASEFLIVMLHWQAVMGGLGRTWSAIVDREFSARLSDWRYAGEVNAMRAYSRDGVALCWLEWEDTWRIFAASTDELRVEKLAEQLSITWDPNYE
jgi:hypothetical protein